MAAFASGILWRRVFYSHYQDLIIPKHFKLSILRELFMHVHTLHLFWNDHTVHLLFACRWTRWALLIFARLSPPHISFSVNHTFLSFIHADVILLEPYSNSTQPGRGGGGGGWRISESWFLWRWTQEATVTDLPGSSVPVLSWRGLRVLSDDLQSTPPYVMFLWMDYKLDVCICLWIILLFILSM